jgi:hypothetical protein
MRWLLAGLLLALVFALAACADEGDPARTMQDYLEALVEADAGTMRQLACAAWEGQIESQANAFVPVDASLRDVECRQSGERGEYTLVSCDGVIHIDYGTEDTELPLSTYQLIREDGEWKMCGEADE